MKDYLYVLQCEGGYLKIGVTNHNNIDKRIKQLQTGNPKKIEVVWFEERPYAQRAEKYLHTAFKDKCTHGEWFEGITLNEIRSKLMMYHDQV